MRSYYTIKVNKLEIIKIKKEVEIAIKSKETSSYLAKILLATYSTGSIGYYLCLFMQTNFLLGI